MQMEIEQTEQGDTSYWVTVSQLYHPTVLQKIL